jgi:hypothetical protein
VRLRQSSAGTDFALGVIRRYTVRQHATVEIAEVTRLATTIDRWRGEVLAYFRTGRSSSGPVEAVNSEIEAVDRAASGFRSFRITGCGCCSRLPSTGRLPPLQDLGAAADDQTLPPPRSSRRAGMALLDEDGSRRQGEIGHPQRAL